MILSEAYLKANSILSEAIDFRLLAPQIAFIEDVKIPDALGEKTSEDLRTKFENQTLTPIEEDAVKILKKMLLGYLEMYAVDTLSTRIRNKGGQKESGNNSTNAPEYNIGQIKAQAEERAEFYKKEVIKFIEANKTEFPLFVHNCKDSDNPYIDVYFN